MIGHSTADTSGRLQIEECRIQNYPIGTRATSWKAASVFSAHDYARNRNESVDLGSAATAG